VGDAGGFGEEVGAVADELGVEAECVADGSFDLGGGVVGGLQAADGGLDEGVERRDVGFGGEADGGFGSQLSVLSSQLLVLCSASVILSWWILHARANKSEIQGAFPSFRRRNLVVDAAPQKLSAGKL
jgi:hypothetical protein